MLIFDFDQTLVDTSSVAHVRRALKWSTVMANMRALEPYPGVTELLAELRSLGQSLAIVTSSPDMVAREYAQRHQWPVEFVVGYHQMRGRQKPNPYGLNLALQQFGADAATSYHVGDTEQDTRASRAAGTITLGAGWDSHELDLLRDSHPDHLFMSVDALCTFLLGALGN